MKYLLPILVFAIFLSGCTLNSTRSTPSSTPVASGTPAARLVSVSGDFVCLPHKETGDGQTLECAFGIKTDKNVYYGLKTENYDDLDFQTDTSVTVDGMLTSTPDSIYDIAGTIEVQSVKKNNTN